jgi:vacuolar protein sorting-associated protein 13A/C
MDIEVDAPIFIFPSNIENESSPLLVLDAGHLKVRSKVIDKEQKANVEQLLSKSVDELLQSIYDRFTIDLTSVKFMLANFSQTNGFANEDYILEDMDFSIAFLNSIMPRAVEYPKFKLEASLPRLILNVSEKKMYYIKKVTKLMTETFLGEEPNPEPIADSEWPLSKQETGLELVRELEEASENRSMISDSSTLYNQTLVDLKCTFGHVSVLLSDETEKGVRSVALFEAKSIAFEGKMKRNEVYATARLGSFVVQDTSMDARPEFAKLMSPGTSAEPEDDLMVFEYQSLKGPTLESNLIKISLRPIKFLFVQESVLKIYKFLNSLSDSTTTPAKVNPSTTATKPVSITKGRMVNVISEMQVKISSVTILLVEDEYVVGSCLFKGFDIMMKNTSNTFRIDGTVGKMFLYDGIHQNKRCVLLIDDEKAMDFVFETFEKTALSDFDSSLILHASSWRFLYDKHYLDKLSQYFGKFKEMQVLMDSAKQVAQESSLQMQQTAGRFYFKVEIQTPIIEVPNGTGLKCDRLVFYLGQISAESIVKESEFGSRELIRDRYSIKLSSIKLESLFQSQKGNLKLNMIEDTNLQLQMDLMLPFPDMPQTITYANFTDVNVKITNHQYRLAVELLQLITSDRPPAAEYPAPNPNVEPTHTEYVVRIPNMSLEVYNCPEKSDSPKKHSLAKFIGQVVTAKMAVRTNHPLKFELCFSSLSVLDTRSSNQSVFRDIMVPLSEIRNQFVLKYEASRKGTEYTVTVDRPKLILEIDHILAIQAFAVSAWYHESDKKVIPLSENGVVEETSTLKGKVSFVDAEIVIIAEPNNPKTDAVVWISRHLVVTQETVITVSFQDLGMFFCVMDEREETELRFVDNCNITFALDNRIRPDGIYTYHASLETTKLLFRVSYQDIMLLNDLVNRVMGSTGSTKRSQDNVNTVEQRPIGQNISQRFRVSVEGIQAVLIDDLNNLHLPVFEFGLDRTLFEITNWSTKLQFDLGVSLFANYFNIKNSHWEPMIESWQFSLDGRKDPETGKNSIVFLCRKKLEINISHVLVETVLGLNKAIQERKPQSGSIARKNIRSPYLIKNLTGYPIVVWTDSQDHPTELVKIENGSGVNWRFDDWRTLRERTAPVPNRLAIQIEGPSWETLKGVAVDREGVNAFHLRPAIDAVLHSCVVEVKMKDKVKEVCIRSNKVIENATNIEIEIGLASRGAKRPKQCVRIKPGDVFPIPIESSFHDFVYVRPADFGYNWSLQGFYWRDMVGKKKNVIYLINCPSFEESVPNFNFQLNMDMVTLNKENPELVLKFMAPFVIENLLPFSFRFVIQDRVNRQQLSSSLEKGAKEYLHTIDPSHLLALNISIPEKELRQKEGIIITSTDLEYRDESLVLKDSIGNELTLRVHYNDSKSSGRTVSIFSPYIILNKTGQDMFFSAKSFMTSNRLTAGQGKQTHNGESLDPILFSYSTFEPLRSRAHIKMRDSDWSRAISFEAVGSSYMVRLPAAGGLDNLLGIDIQEGMGKYYFSKVITISPRFILQNRMQEDLSFGQAGNLSPQLLKANSTVSLIKLRTDPDHDDYQLSVRLSNMLGSWSNPFSITEMGSIHLKLGRIGSLTEDLIRVDISIEKATIFIAFSREEGKWPFRIENHTPVNVCYFQMGSKKQYVVVPGESQSYAWDYPSHENKNLVIEVNEKQRAIEISQLGPLLPFKYTSGNKRGIMAMELVAEGPTIVLKLETYDEAKSIYKDTKPSVQDDFQVKETESKVLTIIQARIEGIGISVISKDMKEIMYASAKGLVIMHTDTTTDTMMNVTLKWFQVDNQLPSAFNPIFIYPTVLPVKGKEKEAEKPVFFGSFSHSKDTSHGVDYYQWLTVLLQELSVDLEEDFLKKMIEFTKFETTEKIDYADAYDPSPQIPFPKSSDSSERLYIENVLLHPIQINMSYTQSDKVRNKSSEREHHGGTLSLVYDVLTMTVGNIHDAPIRLNALELVHVVISKPQFLDLITTFYLRESYGQLHRFIGSADFLGNPAGLFKNVASGVKDMFYEPLQGFEITKPDEFGMGVAKGASSLMKKTVFGLSDTFSKFTGSIGKGLTVLTMDAKFQESRRLASRNRPKHVGQGMASGAASFVRGITSGVTGIVSQPIEGAQEAGVEGFFVGLGKGLLGVVAKPMIGVVDLATNVSEGIKNTTTVFEDELERQRLPRFIGKDAILKPFSLREALGQNWLKEVEHAKFFQETYLCHLELRIDDLAAIVTERRLLMIHTRSLKLEYDARFEGVHL